MESSPLKRFLSLKCCLCCGGQSNKDDAIKYKPENGKVNTVSKPQYEGLQSKESFGEKDENKNTKIAGVPNLAFTKDEDPPVKINQKVISTQPVKQSQNGLFRERQISDISAYFAVSPDDADQNLTDMVMEELDKSMPVLPKSEHNTQTEEENDNDVFAPVATSDDESENSELIEDSNERIRQTLEFAEKKDKVKNIEDEEYTPPSTPKDDPTPIIESTPQPPRSTEWRDKLIQNLMEDDLEFELTDSETEEEVTKKSDKNSCSKTEEENVTTIPEIPPPVDKTKGSTSATNIIKPSSTKAFKTPIVMDNGSYKIKVGYAGEFTPESRFRSVVGRWKSQCGEAWQQELGDMFYGDDALSKHTTLSLSCPQKDGNITNWRDMEYVWEQSIAKEMNCDIKEHPLLITETSMLTKKQRERSLELAIEKMYCPLVHLKSQAALAAHSVGADVALVINSGHFCTQVVPVYFGADLQYAATSVNVGGAQITEYLARLIKKERGHNFESVSEMEILNAIKENQASVHHGGRQLTRTSEKTVEHELPDGQVIQLRSELTNCTEPIFRPDLIGLEPNNGVTQLINNSLNTVDPDLKPELCKSIVLSGGNSRLRGLKERIVDDLKTTNNHNNYSITLSELDSTWIGGSLFAKQENFNSLCISDDLYFEYGPNIVHKMCL